MSSQAFLWDLRYSILNRPEMLPPFVMSVRWSSCEQVQELYDLLDLWAAPTPVQVSIMLVLVSCVVIVLLFGLCIFWPRMRLFRSAGFLSSVASLFQRFANNAHHHIFPNCLHLLTGAAAAGPALHGPQGASLRRALPREPARRRARAVHAAALPAAQVREVRDCCCGIEVL